LYLGFPEPPFTGALPFFKDYSSTIEEGQSTHATRLVLARALSGRFYP
jgi:hypothetical protein